VPEDLDLAGAVVEVDEHAAVAVRADAAGHDDAVLRLGAGGELGITPAPAPPPLWLGVKRCG